MEKRGNYHIILFDGSNFLLCSNKKRLAPVSALRFPDPRQQKTSHRKRSKRYLVKIY